MMRYLIVFILFFTSINLFSQKDSLRVGDWYLEDQLYLSVTYNTLKNQPKDANSSGFSYGLSAGYIRDIPFSKQGNWAAGLGAGYNYDSFNHSLRVDENGNLTTPTGLSSSKILLHNIEFPIQLRWRTSTATTYSFWRIYAGIRLSYNLSNTFKYAYENQNFNFSNVDSYNKFQTGLELSAGYGAFNFYMYYGLTPIYKNVTIENEKVNTKIAKFGLIFYLL